MTTQKFGTFSRWSPVAALLLASLTLNLPARAQDSTNENTTNPASIIFKVEKSPNPSINNFLFGIGKLAES